ncbi:MAG: MFS transporter [Myxococcota bacterium]
MPEGAQAATSQPLPTLHEPSLATRLYYGVGSVAYGVKDNGFSVFLLFYYNQVLGLPERWVGLGIFMALVVDAFSDPVVGYVSDNWHSRWGRRHPFMYFAALPAGLSFYFLFNPPAGLSDGGLFAYFLTLAIVVRTFITLYEIPSTSLVAELSDNYDTRTSMLSFRYFFGWWGGLSMAVLAYAVFLQPTAAFSDGQLNPAGYRSYGIAAGLVMAFAILISAGGTHSSIPRLRPAPERRPFEWRRTLSELGETLHNRSFLVLFAAGIFAAMASGLSMALNLYFSTFFWELSSSQISVMMVASFGSAIIALVAAPRLATRMGKRAAALLSGTLVIFISPIAVVGRLLGWMPENGSPALLPILVCLSALDVSLIIINSILASSMVADVVEESELATGRRSEGLFFAARSFAQKAVSGFGILGSAWILAAVSFPEQAVPGEVSDEVLRNLVLLYLPSVLGLYALFLACLALYRISRESHQQNLRELAERRTPPALPNSP